MELMIKITKKEANQLRAMGVSNHTNGISHTWGHHKHYFLCESTRNLGLLKKIRQEV